MGTLSIGGTQEGHQHDEDDDADHQEGRCHLGVRGLFGHEQDSGYATRPPAATYALGMSRIVFRGGQALLDREFVRCDLVVEDAVIVEVRVAGLDSGVAGSPIGGTSGHIEVDASDLLIAPGFIDLQINGAFGIDLSTEPSAMWDLATLLPRFGVTSFLPTIITAPLARYCEAIDALAAPQTAIGPHAVPLGLHFEGPMLNSIRAGAHPAVHLRAPDLEVIDGWSRERGVALVTLAPELAGADDVADELRRRGVVVSAGHSDANLVEAGAAFGAGIALVTHLFNAMAPLGHRAPNLVGAALTNRGVVAGVIVDGIHVDPVVVDLAWRCKGPEGLLLVTDAVAPMGLSDSTGTRPMLADETIRSDGESVRRPDGTLAGSLLSMDQAMRNLMAFTGCSSVAALRCASTVPAQVIGEHRRGRLARDAVADLVVLNDALEVQMTFCSGRPAFIADGAERRLSRPACTSE